MYSVRALYCQKIWSSFFFKFFSSAVKSFFYQVYKWHFGVPCKGFLFIFPLHSPNICFQCNEIQNFFFNFFFKCTNQKKKIWSEYSTGFFSACTQFFSIVKSIEKQFFFKIFFKWIEKWTFQKGLTKLWCLFQCQNIYLKWNNYNNNFFKCKIKIRQEKIVFFFNASLNLAEINLKSFSNHAIIFVY